MYCINGLTSTIILVGITSTVAMTPVLASGGKGIWLGLDSLSVFIFIEKSTFCIVWLRRDNRLQPELNLVRFGC